MQKRRPIKYMFIFVLLLGFPSHNTYAEEDYENNIEKYLQTCKYDYGANKEMCEDFKKYLERISDEAQRQLEELKNAKEDITENIVKYTQKLNEYDGTISALKKETEFYYNEIRKIEEELSVYHANAQAYEGDTQQTLDAIHERFLSDQVIANTPLLKNKKPNEESLMRIRMAMEKDMLKLKEIYRNLGGFQEEQSSILKLLRELEDEKNQAQNKLSISSELQLEVRKMLVEYRRQEADIIKNTNSTIKELDSVKNKISDASGLIYSIASSEGWIKPVPNGTVSAGTWHYPASFGGGAHTGIDYAATIGTDIVAPANGVVLYSTNGCANDGYLGNRCGSQGLAGGGNQTYLIVSVEDRTYAVSFAHMNDKTTLEPGTVVKAGDKIGEIGSSGNVTGPHSHIETTYLGNISINEYVENWNGDLTFGAGIGQYSLKNTCSNKNSEAPCKLQPETLFGEEIIND